MNDSKAQASSLSSGSDAASDIPMKAVRGAITVETDSPAEILSATRLLMQEIIDANELAPESIISLIFSATDDLTSEFPARAAREMGLDQVPLLCVRELSIKGMLPKCIRILAHTWMPGRKASHIYLREAVRLRSDLVNGAS